MADFATVNDVIAISGINYTSAEQERIATLLPLICNTLRWQGMTRMQASSNWSPAM